GRVRRGCDSGRWRAGVGRERQGRPAPSEQVVPLLIVFILLTLATFLSDPARLLFQVRAVRVGLRRRGELVEPTQAERSGRLRLPFLARASATNVTESGPQMRHSRETPMS